MCNRIEGLDEHWALFFLTRYVAAPRLNYALRTSPLYMCMSALQNIDNIVRTTATKCINVDLSGVCWDQASLPIRLGGLGIRSVANLSLPCYIASLNSSSSLVGQIYGADSDRSDQGALNRAIHQFQLKYGNDELPEGESASLQRTWDDIAASNVFQDILRSSNQVHRARLLAASTPYAGAWLNTTPIPNLGLHLDDSSVRVAVALRTGAQLCEPHPCRCGRRVDRLGHHGLSCRYSAGRLPRHSNLNDVVKRALATAGMPSWLEPVGLDRGDGRRPDGITVYPYSQGKSLCWDATCVDTFSVTSVIDAAVSPCVAATRAEERKRALYSGLTDRYIFEPVAVETTGALGSSTLNFLKRVGKRVSAQTGEKRETAWLFERISLAVVRGNAASVLATGRLDG